MPVKIEWYSMYHTCLKDPFLAIIVQITTAWTEPVFCKSHHLGIVYPETLLGLFMTCNMLTAIFLHSSIPVFVSKYLLYDIKYDTCL